MVHLLRTVTPAAFVAEDRVGKPQRGVAPGGVGRHPIGRRSRPGASPGQSGNRTEAFDAGDRRDCLG